MTTALATALLVAFGLLEIFLRRGDRSRSWRTGAADKGSTRVIIGSYIAVLILPGILKSAGKVRTDSPLAWAAIGIGTTGLVIRIWGMASLGEFYTRTLQVAPGQTVVDRGPYRVVRHPGYLGSILLWVGARLAVNWIVAVLTLVLLAAAYIYRIRAEEALLLDQLGDAYRNYSETTARLVPFVW